MGLGKLHKHIQKNKIWPLFYTLTIISSKWTKDLSVVPKTVKFLEENKGKAPYIDLDNYFLTWWQANKKMKKKMKSTGNENKNK